MNETRDYGLGDDVVVVVVVLSLLFEAAGDSLTTVVLFSVLFSAGGLTVVVSLFSHAVNKATPASMLMYFFIRVGELIATEG